MFLLDTDKLSLHTRSQIQKEYDSEEEDDEIDVESESDDAPELLTSREDFDQIMDEFLEQFEILGGKMKPTLSGETGAKKLDILRRELRQGMVKNRNQDDDYEDDDVHVLLDEKDEKDRWDCETILSMFLRSCVIAMFLTLGRIVLSHIQQF